MTIQELLELTVKNNASDLHLVSGIAPSLRVDGMLFPLPGFPVLTNELIEQLVFVLLAPAQKELLVNNKEIDIAYSLFDDAKKEIGRFRINLYYERSTLAGAFRYLPLIIPTIEELGLPKICHSFAQLQHGFVLFSGPTGHGKSTSLAAIINEINMTRPVHILTIEDPIEYVYPKGKSLISQREIGLDSHSWGMAMRSALREDPDVVLVGEMRDPETMAAAITIAETGHLVFSTVHTNSASQSIDRMIDTFPSRQQIQIRVQLAATLRGIVSQRLLPKIVGGRTPAVEVMIGTQAVASNIRDGKTHLIDSIIQTSQDSGMITLESSLAELVLNGAISMEVAKAYAIHQDELMRLIN